MNFIMMFFFFMSYDYAVSFIMQSVSRLLALAALVLPSVAVDPTVDLGYSKYKGKDLGNGVSEWLGVRYGAAPVKDLRWSMPKDPSRVRAVQDATKVSFNKAR